MTYSFFTNPTATPQTEPISGRESEMVQGRSDAVAFDAGVWVMLRRCLLMGTANGSYYAGKRELTQEFVDVVKAAIAEDPAKAAREIVYASDGKAINNSAPIFALVLLSCGESKAAKQAFREAFPAVVRTGTHFHEWVSYTKQIRGMGRLVRDAGQSWLSRDVDTLSYQFLKYGQRHGFTFRDALRLFKPTPKTPQHQQLFAWAAGKPVDGLDDESLSKVRWYEWLKQNPSQGQKAVIEGGLTHEMVAPIAAMDQKVWQTLFESMPMTATIRNLGSLTEIGVLSVSSVENLNRLESRLLSKENLRKARVHPIDVLKALKTYASGGTLGRSSKTWIPVPRIVDILEDCLVLTFDTQPATGKIFCHAVDVSASMGWTSVKSVGLKCSEIAATMALVTAKAEKNYAIRGFSTNFVDLGITAANSFRNACSKVQLNTSGGTDASVAYDWAIEQKAYFDVFCFWTDSESWAGQRHPSQALAEYRQKINPNAKAVYITLQPNRLELGDPKDSGSFSFAGFDPSIPRLIQMIADGAV